MPMSYSRAQPVSRRCCTHSAFSPPFPLLAPPQPLLPPCARFFLGALLPFPPCPFPFSPLPSPVFPPPLPLFPPLPPALVPVLSHSPTLLPLPFPHFSQYAFSLVLFHLSRCVSFPPPSPPPRLSPLFPCAFPSFSVLSISGFLPCLLPPFPLPSPCLPAAFSPSCPFTPIFFSRPISPLSPALRALPLCPVHSASPLCRFLSSCFPLSIPPLFPSSLKSQSPPSSTALFPSTPLSLFSPLPPALPPMPASPPPLSPFTPLVSPLSLMSPLTPNLLNPRPRSPKLPIPFCFLPFVSPSPVPLPPLPSPPILPPFSPHQPLDVAHFRLPVGFIDPSEMHALSRSLHTLTQLGIIDCPLISSHSLATVAQANPALSSLSLQSTTYHLFSAQGLWSFLRAPPSHLHSLSFSGLPSFRPGLLARCSGLQSLMITGRWEVASGLSVRACENEAGEEMKRLKWGWEVAWVTGDRSVGVREVGLMGGGTSRTIQPVSLESLVSMLVVEVRRGGGEGAVGVECKDDGAEGGEEGEVKEREAVEAGKSEGAVETMDSAAAAASAREGIESTATTSAAVAPTIVVDSRNEGRREYDYEYMYVDIRTAAAAAHADLIAARNCAFKLMKEANEVIRGVFIKAARADDPWGESTLSEIESATTIIRSAIALCRPLRVAISEQAVATEREDAMIEAFSAAEAAAVFMKRDIWEGASEGGVALLEDMDGVLLDNAVAGNGNGGDGDGGEGEGEAAAGNMSPRTRALNVMRALMLQLVDERRTTFEVFERMRTRVARSGAGRPATAAGGDAAASAAGAAAAAVAGADAAASVGGGVPGATCVAAADGTAVVAYLAASAPPLCIPSHVPHLPQSTLLLILFLFVSRPKPECPASVLRVPLTRISFPRAQATLTAVLLWFGGGAGAAAAPCLSRFGITSGGKQ
ncbi:unnamed protein product [Closterium sp. Naga37s-1]|nr:unnamed protein product [Closterium sp. Naga37s-1]